jgi:hypothetical protein
MANRTNVAVWFTAVKFFLRHYTCLSICGTFVQNLLARV